MIYVHHSEDHSAYNFDVVLDLNRFELVIVQQFGKHLVACN